LKLKDQIVFYQLLVILGVGFLFIISSPGYSNQDAFSLFNQQNKVDNIRCSYYEINSKPDRIRISFDFQIDKEELIIEKLNGDYLNNLVGFYPKFEIKPGNLEDEYFFEDLHIDYSNSLKKIKIESIGNSIHVYINKQYNLSPGRFYYLGNKQTAYIDLRFIPIEKTDAKPVLKKKHSMEIKKLYPITETNLFSSNHMKSGIGDSSQTEYLLKLTEGQYVLGPRDLLKIHIYFDASDRDRKAELEAVPVKLDGNVYVPVIGDISAEGLTAELLALNITEKLKQDFLKPYATVEILESRSNTVTILGNVLHQKLSLFKSERLHELLLRNSILLTHEINLDSILIKQKNGREITVKLSEYIAKSDMSQNPELSSGDMIYLYKQPVITIIVLGAIGTPGIYEYNEPVSLIHCIARAGGFGAGANLKKIRHRSMGEEKANLLDLSNYIKGKTNFPNPVLQDGDIIFISPKREMIGWALIKDVLYTFSTAVSLYFILSR